MMWLVCICIGVLLSVSVLGDLFRFYGSNPNTVVNELVNLYKTSSGPFNEGTPEFANNITIRANVTDADDLILWVNFTLTSPSGESHIHNENGTQYGDFWNSTHTFRLNETGNWIYNFTSMDNNTINSTYNTYEGTVAITDVVTLSENEIQEILPINITKNYTIEIETDTREPLNFTIHNPFDGNFSINLTTDIVANSTGSTIYLNVTPGASSLTGSHFYNITIERELPFTKNISLLVNLTVSSNYGDVEWYSGYDYGYVTCASQIEHSAEVINNGNYPLTNCYPYLEDTTTGAEVSSGSRFDVSAGKTETAEVVYNLGSGNRDTWFIVECTATPEGGIDKTNNNPKISFSSAANCGGGGPGGGGGGVRIETPKPEAPAPTEPTIAGYCGDDFCDDTIGENPLSCSADCVPDLFNLEKIFCTPLFACGNWETSWFINGVIVIIMGNMVFFSVKGRKVRRLSA